MRLLKNVASKPCTALAWRELSVSAKARVSCALLARHHRCSTVCLAEKPSLVGSSADAPDTPWYVGFQMNERYLEWDASAARQLVRNVLARKLDMSEEEIEAKLTELAVLIPDMVGKLEQTRADVLHNLITDLPRVAVKLMALKDMFPGINVSELVARYPPLLLEWEPEQLAQRLQEMRSQLPGVRVEVLVNSEPMMLKANLALVLKNIRRIMPTVNDPITILVAQPQMVLDMQSAGMPSAADVEGPAPKFH